MAETDDCDLFSFLGMKKNPDECTHGRVISEHIQM